MFRLREDWQWDGRRHSIISVCTIVGSRSLQKATDSSVTKSVQSQSKAYALYSLINYHSLRIKQSFALSDQRCTVDPTAATGVSVLEQSQTRLVWHKMSVKGIVSKMEFHIYRGAGKLAALQVWSPLLEWKSMRRIAITACLCLTSWLLRL